MHGQTSYQNLIISEFLAHSEGSELKTDWVELYNGSKDTIDVAGCFWSDNREALDKREIEPHQPEEIKIAPGGFLVFWFIGKETPYSVNVDLKLDKDKGWIGLTSSDGLLIDSLAYGKQALNVPSGRIDMVDKSVYYFHKASIGTFNKYAYSDKLLKKPKFSVKGGFYNEAQFVELTNDDGAEILYTTDGSTPSKENANVQIYKQPIYIESTTVVRALCAKKGYLDTDVRSHTYFINEEHTFPVISLSVDNWNEYQNSDKDVTDKEIKAYIEFYDTNGIEAFDDFVGLSLAGGGSRRHPQKSISIHTRPEYGSKWMKYRFFEHKSFEKLRAFVLRNSGNAVPKVQFKDAFMQEVIGSTDADLDYLASRPTIAYINGEYWGIYNLREKKCKHYFEDNHGVEGDSIDYLSSFYFYRKRGVRDELEALIEVYNSDAIGDSLKSDRFLNKIDVGHYIDYQVAEIFYANTDWPINNVRMWKVREKDAQWRWLMFDIDLAYRRSKIEVNSVEYAMGVNNFHGDRFSEPLTRASSILRSWMTYRPELRNHFVNRFADLLNTTFSSENLLSETDRFREMYLPEMPRHIDRWNIENENVKIKSMERWERGLENMRDFARERPDKIREFLQLQWDDLGDIYEVTVSSNLVNAGEIKVNSVTIDDDGEWKGVYFANNEIQLTAKAYDGHKFVRWEYGGKKSKDNILKLKPGKAENIVVKAIYK